MAIQAEQLPELSSKDLREFGLVTGAIFAGLFGLLFPWLLEHSFPLWPWIVFAALAVPALVAPRSLKPVYRAWMRFGLLISRFTTPLILGIVFYLIITPTGLFRRMIGKDAMEKTPDKDCETYRISSRKPSVKNMERPF